MLPSIGKPAVDDEDAAEPEMRLEVGWALDEHVTVNGRRLGSLAIIELEAVGDLQPFGGILSRQCTGKAQHCRGERGDQVTSGHAGNYVICVQRALFLVTPSSASVGVTGPVRAR